MSEFGNGSGVDLERQGKRLIQVYGDLPVLLLLMLDTPLDAMLDAQCVYTLKVDVKSYYLAISPENCMEIALPWIHQ